MSDNILIKRGVVYNPKISKIDVVIVSVDYNDFLQITLQNNIKTFDNITVVTSSNDLECQKICKDFGVKCIITDRMYENGDKFNKGKAINDGIKSIVNPDWILLLDADIIVPNEFKTSFECIDDSVLYVCDRIMCKDFECYNRLKSGLINTSTVELSKGLGYFHLFNYKSGIKFPETSDNAAGSDISFRNKFTNRVNTKIPVIHLGEAYQNWTGRKSRNFITGESIIKIEEVNNKVNKPNYKICSYYFNFRNDERIKTNFLEFIKQFEGRYDELIVGIVDYGDIDFELPCESLIVKGDVNNKIWSKEILINRIIDKISEDVKYLLWIDGDLIYDNLDWLDNLEDLVKGNDFVQLFEDIKYLDINGNSSNTFKSAVYKLRSDFKPMNSQKISKYESKIDFKPGGSWLGKMSILREKKLFEKMYVGGGDVIFLYGINSVSNGLTLDRVKESNLEIYNESINWINSFGGIYNVGYLSQSITHLYHGDLSQRNYINRYKELSKFQKSIEPIIKKKRQCSVIVPAYKATEFILDCIESILSQSIDIDIEILIGVDKCEETLDFIKNSDIIKNNCKVYYFLENSGPYLIRNTLSSIAKYENLIFFDADDIMSDLLIQKTIDSLLIDDVVRWGFYNFTESIESKKLSTMYANGAFAIKKEVLLKLNGFLPWRISADSEFRYRLKHNGYRTNNSNDIRFLRRIHKDNLTQRKDTGMKSKERLRVDGEVNKMIESNTFKNPELLNVSTYEEVKFEIDINKYFDKIYCLNLDRRIDRIENMKLKLDKLQIEFTRFPAIDGNVINMSNFDLTNYKSSNDSNNFKYEVACILSHIEIIKDAKINEYNRILILEDDVLISNEINNHIQKISDIEDWKLLYLGSSQYNWNIEKYSDDFFYSKDSLGTFAYAIDSSIYEEMIESLSNFETTLDNSISKIQLKYYKKCYTFFPNICIADVSDSDIRESRDNKTHSVRMKWNLLKDYV
jgi:GR25 family glycosyltransferase involved in LPS biosynthesis